MADATLGVQLGEDSARAVVLEPAGEGWRLLWRGTVSGASGRESLARRLGEELAEEGVEFGAASLALPASPSSVYQTLELPPLRGEELTEVARNELRREMGADAVRGLEVRAWQFGGAGRINTLAVGVPSEMVEGTLAFGRALETTLLGVTVPPLVLHRGHVEMEALEGGRATGLAHVDDQFGFVAYVLGERWVLIHHFPVPPDEVAVDGVVRETKQSFTFLRSRAPEAGLGRMVLSGPGLPEADLAARLEEELAGAEVDEFSFPAPLDLEGMAHGTEFLRRQGAYAVPLLLAARPEASPVDFLPASERLPRIKRRYLRGAAAAVGAGLLAAALHAGLAWRSASGVADRLSGLEEELASLGPRLERLRSERRTERAATAALHLRELADQQSALGPAALRRLSFAVGEGITMDSLRWRTDGDGWRMRMFGRATGGSSSEARRRLSGLLAELRSSPVFLEARAGDQQVRRLAGGAFQVRFAITARLMDGGTGG